MTLLQSLQNRGFQFSLALLSLLQAEYTLDRNTVLALGANYRLDIPETEKILSALNTSQLLELETGSGKWICRHSGNSARPDMPAQPHVLDYLQYILRLPEASLFLPADLREKLLADTPDALLQLHRLIPENSTDTPRLCPEDFQTLLQAICQQREICYSYRTKDSQDYIRTTCVPWKLEHSVYDSRWWVILYDPTAGRTIKAVLSNLQDVHLGGKHGISEAQILEAMDALKDPEPVRLVVKDTKNALERCFLCFENREFIQTEALGEDLYSLAFTYYRFDTEEILRKLLYLGPAVTLAGPESLKNQLRSRILQGLAQQKEA